MTAEITILNRSAIALAADSAVTVQTIDGPKIYNTADKLFRLSKNQPVGALLYGQASFLQVPWEIIIKEFRKKLGNRSFSTLEEYCDEFIKYISENQQLFPEKQQDDYVHGIITMLFRVLNEKIIEKVDKHILSKGRLTKTIISKMASDAIKAAHSHLKEQKLLPTISAKQIKEINARYSDKTKIIIDEVFEKIPLYKKDKVILKEIPGLYFCNNIFSDNISGLVIAGFGQDDIFPKVQSYKFETIVTNCLKYEVEKEKEITHENGAIVAAYAQGEMVYTFMEGIDPSLDAVITTYIKDILYKYPDLAVNNIKGISLKKKKEIAKVMKQVSTELFKDYLKSVVEYKEDRFILPVTSAVAVLPKDELAAMAESLVNLTVFKQRVSMGSETVGGPIDVAVISKGDGFVWIKRKYYFKKEMNPRYYTSYYQKGEANENET